MRLWFASLMLSIIGQSQISFPVAFEHGAPQHHAQSVCAGHDAVFKGLPGKRSPLGPKVDHSSPFLMASHIPSPPSPAFNTQFAPELLVAGKMLKFVFVGC